MGESQATSQIGQLLSADCQFESSQHEAYKICPEALPIIISRISLLLSTASELLYAVFEDRNESMMTTEPSTMSTAFSHQEIMRQWRSDHLQNKVL